jgi:hypothetical protein
MVPASVLGQPEDRLPEDLVRLRVLHDNLPHRKVRWQTQPGNAFLDALFEAVDRHKAKTVAEVLGRTPQGVYYMMNRKRFSKPRPWPTQGDLRELRTAWRSVAADIDLARSISRQDTRYIAVHTALTNLLHRFAFLEVSLALGVPARQLHRFEEPPLDSPEVLARAIEKVLPDAGGRSSG